jgi:hypothetical protein
MRPGRIALAVVALTRPLQPVVVAPQLGGRSDEEIEPAPIRELVGLLRRLAAQHVGDLGLGDAAHLPLSFLTVSVLTVSDREFRIPSANTVKPAAIPRMAANGGEPSLAAKMG